MKKLFVVTRSDLAEGARAVQLAHGGIQFQHEHPAPAREWFNGSNNIVLLEAPNEAALTELEARARAAGVPVSLVREPDMGDVVTAVALGDGASKLVSCLPRALRPPRAA